MGKKLNKITLNLGVPQKMTSDEIDALARVYAGTRLGLEDTGEPLIPGVTIEGLTIVPTDGYVQDAVDGLSEVGVETETTGKTEYVRVLDEEVLRVLNANGVGADGKITKAQAEAVTSIGTWFKENTLIEYFNEFSLTKVSSISSNAFCGCTSLKKISLPSSITTINDSCFYNCSSLNEITFNGTSPIDAYALGAFYGCVNLKKVNIPSIEKFISISFRTNDSNPLYYGGSLYIDDQLVTDVIIPSNITNVRNLFSTGIKTITLHSGVTSLSGCNISTLENINLEDSNVTVLGDLAFADTTNLKEIDLSNIVTLSDTSNGRGVFCNSGIEKVTFSNTLQHLGGNGYGGGCFFNCKKLKDIIYKGTIEEWNAVEKVNGWNSGCNSITVHCSDGDVTL